jgi:hypothetical protein
MAEKKKTSFTVTVSIVAYEIGFLFSYDISISPGFYCLFSLLLSIFFLRQELIM